MDSLTIKGLAASTRIGIHDWEQRIAQRLNIDLIIPADFSDCQDDINKTIDYDRLCALVTKYVESNSFKLIETVAESVAALIKQEFGIHELTVRVNKPHAVKNAADITVSITR
ncbi:dihydroneopterin aldolase [Legionella spiritensis]|uniref:7,8-dihydroneopterin aldolase n=1 Tax=Legionella spiritensis TaxID=452 RepID=A0A0W0YYG3_LEGSP|nr:dihydroneopterin aldolase [Legionella spiritensis]KTD61542.1 dihydroneopterin aldolase FolB [Legionella spiritensis]SNV32604.1 dihydroneopterin aldolase [Legionella spiritensis]